MSRPSWQDSFLAKRNALASAQDKPIEALRVAILGIGSELRGDDAAGVLVARALAPRYAGSDTILILDTGGAPENHTGPVRRFAPDLVLLVDAAQMNTPPGSIQWLDWQDTIGLSASTHTMPPYMLAKYLHAALGCEIALLGIQAQNNALNAPLSPEVQEAVQTIVNTLILLL